MSGYVAPTALQLAIKALEDDLLHEDGPQISAVRNYNFAILPYRPRDEYAVRQRIHALSEHLRERGWTVGSIPLHALLLARLRASGPELVEALIRREKALSAKADPWRGLRLLEEKIGNELHDEKNGLGADVVRAIGRVLDDSGADPRRTVLFLARAGALYPFYRSSALLKHISGHTRGVPVVLLYPGTITADDRLSFMGVVNPDGDYRPRIYR